MNHLSEIGPQIIHKFVVINSGPSMLDVLTVRIQWPFQVASEWPQEPQKLSAHCKKPQQQSIIKKGAPNTAGQKYCRN